MSLVRSAPPVQVRCHGVAWHWVQCAFMALAAAALSAWILLHAEWPAWPAAGVALSAGFLASRALRCGPLVLAWDGRAWLVDAAAGQVDVMLDMGGAMLLRFRPLSTSPRHWIALTRRETGAAEHALRVALYARATVASDAATDLWRGS